MSSLITIGQITGNQGNKGEVKVYPLTDNSERFKLLDKVFLQKEGKHTDIIEKNIEKVWFHKNYVIIKFEDINDIEQALALKKYYIKIEEELLLPLADNQYYIYKLIDYKVETVTGKIVGKLVDVLVTGGTDVFMVRDDNNCEYMIPATTEIITEINESNQKIIIDPIPGLLD